MAKREGVGGVGNGSIHSYNINGWNNKNDNGQKMTKQSSVKNLTSMMFSGQPVKKVCRYTDG